MIRKLFIFAAVSVAVLAQDASAKNLHLIDDAPNGYAIYRSGTPSRKEVKQWCEMGIQEVMVLSGDAAKAELKYAKECPTLKIIYNEEQSAKVALTTTFLDQFDKWVESSRHEGKKILFRCNCGCHRTGRLAAYYRMKYNGYTADEAIDEMMDLGKWMFLFPKLKYQVRAMDDYIAGRACSVEPKQCVSEEEANRSFAFVE